MLRRTQSGQSLAGHWRYGAVVLTALAATTLLAWPENAVAQRGSNLPGSRPMAQSDPAKKQSPTPTQRPTSRREAGQLDPHVVEELVLEMLNCVYLQRGGDPDDLEGFIDFVAEIELAARKSFGRANGPSSSTSKQGRSWNQIDALTGATPVFNATERR